MKKILGLGIVMALGLGLVGCGSSEGADESSAAASTAGGASNQTTSSQQMDQGNGAAPDLKSASPALK